MQDLNTIASVSISGLSSFQLILDSHDGKKDGTIVIAGLKKDTITIRLVSGVLFLEGQDIIGGCTFSSIEGGNIMLSAVGNAAAKVSIDSGGVYQGSLPSFCIGDNASAFAKIVLVLPPSLGIVIKGAFGEVTMVTPPSIAERIVQLQSLILQKRQAWNEKALGKEKKAVDKRDQYLAKAQVKRTKAATKREEANGELLGSKPRRDKYASKMQDAGIAEGEAIEAEQEAESFYEQYTKEAAALRKEGLLWEQKMHEEVERLKLLV